MTEKFQNKYRIPSARATWHDYNGGMYFVTLCTKNREHYFGEIVRTHDVGTQNVGTQNVGTQNVETQNVETQNFASLQGNEPQMILSEIGKCAEQCLNDVHLHFPHVDVPLFVVMPNHIHAIIIIAPIVETQNVGTQNVETQNFASLRDNGNKFGPQSKNLASVVRGFKIGVTKFARQNAIPFAWQTRFHDRIIRDQNGLNRIAEYIENNVANWRAETMCTSSLREKRRTASLRGE